ncbi:uncharacterized protein HMPREF1541_07632 [Cyphellophora europaea CBS 101466]|uniref:Uncharacterized protein n=1 Tax=Cyphellophora europaea (strain CBS 101466) TaxID=1220924 RepID=W2RQL7_CYPE1|nr:uncharacterized protein HMPREF1541_07632 [Cyphellophora europaea CBS 101466]ETN38009.1 hypothetical protein HMPREF1541_07632 [Cyphellophora europaea CBS 101466]
MPGLRRQRHHPIAQSTPTTAPAPRRMTSLRRSRSFSQLSSQMPYPTSGSPSIYHSAGQSPPLRPTHLLDSLIADELVRTSTADDGRQQTPFHDRVSGRFYTTTTTTHHRAISSASTVKATDGDDVQDAEPWDPDLESGSAGPSSESSPNKVEVAARVLRMSLWTTVKAKARQDPMATAGIMAGVIVLPFVIRGATK